MQLGHAWIVQILAAAHRIGEMNAPIVAIIHIAHGSRHAALGHHGVGLAEQRFRDYADLNASAGSFDGRPQSSAARADHQHIMFDRLVFRRHQRILQSVQMPMEHILTYRSEKATQKRLIHAKSMWRRFMQLTQSYSFLRTGRRESTSKIPPVRWRSEWQPSV